MIPSSMCSQINLQTHLGGGEIYTAFMCRALDELGVATRLFHHGDARFWDGLHLPQSTQRVAIDDIAQLSAALPTQRSWLLSHGPLPTAMAEDIAQKHLVTAIAHMPPQGRASDRYLHHHLVFGVSAYVIAGLRNSGVPVWEQPLYGVADLRRKVEGVLLQQRSCYDWDLRKGRDRLFSWIEPMLEPLRSRPVFEARAGITLGIVSRITPIKQFPPLFAIVAPKLAELPQFNLEIFGAGGYASVRDLKHALHPLGARARFWGQQSAVADIYPQLDYLLTGLPEKEALGLNVIEAQACGTPVLAIDAPPFNDTVVNGRSGFLYRDPRQDGGENFAALLARIANDRPKIDPRDDSEHLARFSFEAFVDRLRPIVGWAKHELMETTRTD